MQKPESEKPIEQTNSIEKTNSASVDAPLTVVSVFQQASTNSANVTAMPDNVKCHNKRLTVVSAV